MVRRTDEGTKIARILADPRYWDATHPAHEAITAEATRAFREAYPEPAGRGATVHVSSYTRTQGGKRVEVAGYDRTAHARDGETNTALEWYYRALITPQMAAKAQSVIRSLTRLPDDQVRKIYDQVINNLSYQEVREFSNIDPDRTPVMLSRRQFDIVTSQLRMLTPDDLRASAVAAFQRAQAEGRVVVAP